MDTLLNEKEIRVLGCLMEKSMATPDYYPLSLNALVNACNQKSNRDPVVTWDESIVQDALDSLEKNNLVDRSSVGRVPKYEETFTRKHNMVGSEAAVLCVLLLRGPQTPGALRSRAERMHTFESLEVLQETLMHLEEWDFVHKLPRLPGHKESRFMHRLGEKSDDPTDSCEDPESEESSDQPDRLTKLEMEVMALSDQAMKLKVEFTEFRKEFE